MTKCGYVTLFGLPNAGKSTLLNRLLNYNLSVVTNKVQTTRNKIAGTLTEKNHQIIFLDTPGFLEPKYELQKFMLKEITSSFEDADIILNIIDANKYIREQQREIYSKITFSIKNKIVIPVFSKCDLLKNGSKISLMTDFENELSELNPFFVSGLTGENIDELKKRIIELLPESPFLFDGDYLTDKPEKFFVAEIIRKSILENYREEIPYSVFINIVEYKEREKGKLYIHAEIIVERESQKIILIGKRGLALKKTGETSRKEIEKFLGSEVFLKLFVKVRKDWRNNKSFLSSEYRGI